MPALPTPQGDDEQPSSVMPLSDIEQILPDRRAIFFL
jgi:hypothetical protein